MREALWTGLIIFEKLEKGFSWDRLKTESDRWTMVRKRGSSATRGLYTEGGRSGTSAIHAAVLTRCGSACQWLHLIPQDVDGLHDQVRFN